MLGTFMRPTTMPKRFKLDVIRYTCYGVIAEKPRVGHLPDFFRYSVVKKTMRCIKND